MQQATESTCFLGICLPAAPPCMRGSHDVHLRSDAAGWVVHLVAAPTMLRSMPPLQARLWTRVSPAHLSSSARWRPCRLVPACLAAAARLAERPRRPAAWARASPVLRVQLWRGSRSEVGLSLPPLTGPQPNSTYSGHRLSPLAVQPTRIAVRRGRRRRQQRRRERRRRRRQRRRERRRRRRQRRRRPRHACAGASAGGGVDQGAEQSDKPLLCNRQNAAKGCRP